MIDEARVKLGYKHLETDVEFRTRLFAFLGKAAKYWEFDLSRASGAYLDEVAWAMWKMQRKLVEVFP